MSDIADELRAFEGSEALGNGDFSVCYRGAAEIASLRAELDTARREGMAEAVSQARARADFWSSGTNKEAKIRHDEARKIADAISAAAKEDRPIEEIIREDRDAWPDRQANDPIRAAARREGMEEAAKIAAGSYPDESRYDPRSPLYGMDLNPDRSEFGRGKEAGRKEAAAAIRAAAKEGE